MRAIERTTQLKRDFKREMRGRRRATLESDLTTVLRALAGDTLLAENYRDHPLSGDWSTHNASGDHTRVVTRAAVRISSIRTPELASRSRMSLNTGALPEGSEIVRSAVNGTPSGGTSSAVRVR